MALDFEKGKSDARDTMYPCNCPHMEGGELHKVEREPDSVSGSEEAGRGQKQQPLIQIWNEEGLWGNNQQKTVPEKEKKEYSDVLLKKP